MNKVLFFGSILSLLVLSCTSNQITGRKAILLFSDHELAATALTNYNSILSQSNVVPGNRREAQIVNRAGQRIVDAIKEYYKSKGIGYKLSSYNWEINLIENSEVNAWAMPGGKIMVYTGLLRVAQNEAALAAVMGHEVSHALFSHGNERLSQTLLQQLSGTVLQEALAKKPQETRDLVNVAFGLTSNYGVLLPFERSHELEADRYGMIWMAMAGYDPNEAIKFWERMKKASGGNAQPGFLSSHPSDQTRIERLQRYLPEAMAVYKPVK
jgi:predicted Zn-dependent protease